MKKDIIICVKQKKILSTTILYVENSQMVNTYVHPAGQSWEDYRIWTKERERKENHQTHSAFRVGKLCSHTYVPF